MVPLMIYSGIGSMMNAIGGNMKLLSAILSGIAYGTIGIVLATVGVSIDKWQFWVIMLCMFLNGFSSYVSRYDHGQR